MSGARRRRACASGWRRGWRVALLALLATLAAAGSALAHGALRRSQPASGATLDTAPRLLRLTYNEPVELAVAALELAAADGTPVALSPLRLERDSAQVLLADVTGPLAAGRYTVSWRVVGRDGHPVRGKFNFTVAPGAQGIATAAPPASPPAASVTPARETGAAARPAALDEGGEARRREVFDAESPLYAALRWASLLTLVPLLGVVAFRWLVLRPLGTAAGGVHAPLVEGAGARAWSMGLALGAALAATLLARLAAQGVATFGAGGLLDLRQLLGLVRGTGWGTGWLLQAGGLAVLVGGLARARRSGGAAGWGAAGGGAVLLAAGVALSGHAAAAPLVGVALASAAAHVLAAAGWLGMLLVVLVAGLPAARRLADGERVRGAAALVRTFSRAALVCAAVLIVSGVVNAGLELGTLGALWASAYGRTLLVKLALLLPVALLGAYNWQRVVPALEEANGAARMRRTATIELVFAALVLLATAVLVATPTPLEGGG